MKNAQMQNNEDERESLRKIVEGLGSGVLLTDLNDTVLYANPKMASITGYSAEEMVGWSVLDDILCSAQLATAESIAEDNSDEIASSYEIEIRHKSGLLKWLEIQAVAYRDKYRHVVGHLLTTVDVTDRVKAEKALYESERRLRLALEAGGLGWWELDVKSGTFSEFSSQCKAHFGLPPQAPITYQDFKNFVHPADRARVYAATEKAILNQSIFISEYRVVWRNGSTHNISSHGVPVIDPTESGLRFIGITQNITDRKALESERELALREAEHRADTDPVTGLLNHRAFHKRFKMDAARSLRSGTNMAVIMMDINNFRFFNDAYSHAVGDDVLRNITQKLRMVCRPYDILARFGGDEFVIILSNIGTAKVADVEERIADAMRNLSYTPVGDASNIPLTASIGASLFPGNSDDRLEALKQADERMRWIKAGGIGEAEAKAVRNLIQHEYKGFSMLDALVTAVDNKDRYTRRHSEDVMVYCRMIAEELGVDEEVQRTIAVASLIHDLGKIGVPDAILRKPGKLTNEEFEAIKLHPDMGAAIVSAVHGFEGTLSAVRHHHERWDGAGYPSGLRGDSTPFIARLMAVADAYSAMTTDRPYRKGMSVQDAMSILKKGSGSQWDPVCIQAFIRSQKLRAEAA